MDDYGKAGVCYGKMQLLIGEQCSDRAFEYVLREQGVRVGPVQFS
jgi:hypothetical protein